MVLSLKLLIIVYFAIYFKSTTIFAFGDISNSNESISIQPFRKCCSNDEILERVENSSGIFNCVNYTTTEEEFKWIRIFKSVEDEIPSGYFPLNESTVHQSVLTGIPICNNGLSILVDKDDGEIWFQYLETGEVKIGLHYWFWPIWLPVKNDYCMDVLEGNEALLFCHVHRYDEYILHKQIYWTSFVISSIFLFLTLLIYWILKSQRNVLQLSYFIALFIYYSAESCRIYLKMDGLHIQPSRFCVYQAIFSLYIGLVCSSTLTVLGFDLLWKFWKMQPPTVTKKKMNMKSIVNFILLPWLIPFVGLILAYFYNNHFYSDEKEDMGLTKFGHSRCTSPLFRSVVVFQSIVYLTNIVYFVITIIVIINTLWITKRAKTSSCTGFATDTFKLLLKILLVMGITLVVSVGEIYFGYYEPLAWYWVFSRIFLFGLQGFWIFAAFGFTARNRQLLKVKFNLF